MITENVNKTDTQMVTTVGMFQAINFLKSESKLIVLFLSAEISYRIYNGQCLFFFTLKRFH